MFLKTTFQKYQLNNPIFLSTSITEASGFSKKSGEKLIQVQKFKKDGGKKKRREKTDGIYS